MVMFVTLCPVTDSQIFPGMLLPKITGTMIRAGRVFAHLSQEQLAARAGIHRDCLRTWEGSSDAVPGAQYRTLCKLIDVLQSEGIRFHENGGVYVERAVSIAGATIHSEATA
jgi:hypothetical protein